MKGKKVKHFFKKTLKYKKLYQNIYTIIFSYIHVIYQIRFSQINKQFYNSIIPQVFFDLDNRMKTYNLDSKIIKNTELINQIFKFPFAIGKP